MIHYIQPYSSEKNIGGAINSAITQLAASGEEWIVLTDHDVLWLLPDSKAQVESILNATSFDILGPVTNRVAMNYQLHQGMFNVYDIRKHIEVAKSRQEYWNEFVEPYNHPLAAFCLCFRVNTWTALGGFAEKSIQFDSLFCERARMGKMKLGLMLGVYLFHAYRMRSDNPAQDITHLLPSV